MNSVRRIMILAALFILVIVILVLTGRFAVENAFISGFVTADVRSTPISGQPTPIAPFGPIDPAIIPALQSTPGSKPFGVLPSVQPIGVYLPGIAPRTQLESPTPTFTLPPLVLTPTPTQTPITTPTWTPFPTGYPTPTPFPTDIPVEDVGIVQLQNLRMTPNAKLIGSDCAPHGLPVDGILTQRFYQYHSGVDLGVASGTPVLATHSGQVIFAGWSVIGYGWLVIVQNEHYTTYYAHNTSFNVVQWQYVKAGEIISFSGSTGNSSGPHVHYETRIDNFPVDPLTFDLRRLRTC